MTSPTQLTLELDSLPYTIHRLPSATPASVYLPRIENESWFSITKTLDEVSLVVSHGCAETESWTLNHKVSSGWSCFKVIGPLDFSVVGIMANLSGALAKNSISVFVVSTYDTDYVLVKAASAMSAKETFEKSGHIVRVL